MAGAYLLAYLTYFFSLDLPNAGKPDSPGEKFSRAEIWQAAIPLLVPDSEPLAVSALRKLGDLHRVPERLPIVWQAALIVLAALAIGHAVLTRIWHRRVPASWHTNAPNDTADRDLLTTAERGVFAYGIGLSLLSTATLSAGLAGCMNRIAALVLLGAAAVACLCRVIPRLVSRETSAGAAPPDPLDAPAVVRYGGAAAIVLFLTISLLGAMLPATDFDVREYHLQGPKEFYLAGRITMLPHNVYTNMPFGTEMLSLLGMVVAGDWWWGALVGQTVLASYAPATAVCIFALGRRLISTRAGAAAACLYVTTPWVYRIAIIPYTENALSFYLVAATLCGVLALRSGNAAHPTRSWIAVGMLAGSATSCKYPALISTVLPTTAMAALAGWRRAHIAAIANRLSTGRTPLGSPLARVAPTLGGFALGVALTWGPWLLKNLALTGNPVYPLAYEIFGGVNWTTAKDLKWDRGHQVPGYSLALLGQNLLDVTVKSDWLSPLLFGLAPLAFLRRRDDHAAEWLAGFVLFLFLQWWALTHRIDRFWLPLLPLVAVLAGAGATWTTDARWRWLIVPVSAGCVYFNFSYATTGLCGYNDYLSHLTTTRRDPTDEVVNALNSTLPIGSRLLAVGAADLFHLVRPVVYNTVFDDCVFETIARGKSSSEVRTELHEHQISHIYLHWGEVVRYRDTYGYTSFVTPRVFSELEQAGVLLRRLAVPGEIIVDGTRVPRAVVFEVARGG